MLDISYLILKCSILYVKNISFYPYMWLFCKGVVVLLFFVLLFRELCKSESDVMISS